MTNNRLKKLHAQNDATQAGLPEKLSRMVDSLLTEMDGARMGAVDREVVRRDMMTMVLERNTMGVPIPDEPDDELREMCGRIVAETGYRSRLEQQLYVVLGVQLFVIVDDLFVVWSMLTKGASMMPASQLLGVMLLINLVWYYAIYKCYRQQAIFGKRARPVGIGVTIGLALGAYILFLFAASVMGSMTAGITISSSALYASVALDALLLWVAKRSYNRYIDSQCDQYNLV